MNASENNNRKMVLAALFLALAMALPFLTGQIQQIGKMLCPMHIPVILCGFFCGPWYGLVVGLIAPLLRFFIFGMPPIMPTGLAMCFELATYGFLTGLLYQKLPARKSSIYITLITVIIAGRVVSGVVMAVISGIGKTEFGFFTYVVGTFANSIPGIIVQLVIIPLLVMALNRHKNVQA